MQRTGVGCSEWKHRYESGDRLLPAVGGRNVEGYASVIIGLFGCGHVQICKRNLFRALRGKVPQCLPDDRVIADFFLVLIAIDEHCRWQSRLRLRFARRSRTPFGRSRSVFVLIVFLFLAPHANFFQVLPIPLGRHCILAIVLFIEAAVLFVPRTPEPRVRVTPAPPRRTPAPTPVAATEAVTAVVKVVEVVVMMSVGSVIPGGTMTECRTG